MRKYTIFSIKKDAIKRGIDRDIIRDISEFYTIKNLKELNIDRKTALHLKDNEWKTNWNPSPSDEVKRLCCNYESGKVIVVLCEINTPKDAVKFGTKLKGLSYLPHLCSKKSIRGKYADASMLNRLHQDKLNKIFVLLDRNGKKISTVPNILHSVDNDIEFNDYMSLFFTDVKL
ncbi:MAG: hypothetical protein WCI57_00830 [Candidatus Berkelbacteria bacterium]